MTRNKIILISGVLIAVISLALYLAARTLSPREYTAAESPLSNLGNEPVSAPELSKPTAPSQPIAPANPPLDTPPSGVRIATDSERVAYADAAPKPADTASIPQGFLDVVAHSYGKKDIIIAERPSALVPSFVWKYDPTTRALSTLVAEERGAMFIRSSNGAFSLSSRTLTDGSISLIYEKTSSQERRPLRFATIPPKCFLEGDRALLYCGVPISLPPRAVMPDDYLQRKFYTDDRIVRINLEDIRVDEIPTETDISLDIYEPRNISGKLVFVNRRDGLIYAIPIPK